MSIFAEQRIDRMKELWPSELTTPEIAGRLCISTDTLYRIAREHGLPKRHIHRAVEGVYTEMADTALRSAYRAQCDELRGRYVALSLRVQAERRAA